MNCKRLPCGYSRTCTLIAAADQCHRIAMASISPEMMVGELKRAVDLLNVEMPDASLRRPRSRPSRCA